MYKFLYSVLTVKYMSEVHWIIREFVEKYIDLIEDDDFDALYTLAAHYNPVINICSLTDLLDELGIETLPYLTVIPNGYLRHSRNSHKYIKIPAHVTAIEGNAFSGIDVEEVIFEEGCEVIFNNVFSMCPELKSVHFPKSLRKIASRVFNGCTNLDKIHYAGTVEDWKSIHLGRMWFTANPQYYRDLQIICSDGIVEPFKQES